MYSIVSSVLSILASEIREIKSDKRALRSFGLVVGSVLLIIVGISFWRRGFVLTSLAEIVAVVGLGLIIIGLVLPKVLLPLQKIWMALAVVLGFVMTRVLLTLVFALIVTPIGLALRLLRKDPLSKHPDSTLDTYWIEKDDNHKDPHLLTKYY